MRAHTPKSVYDWMYSCESFLGVDTYVSGNPLNAVQCVRLEGASYLAPVSVPLESALEDLRLAALQKPPVSLEPPSSNDTQSLTIFEACGLDPQELAHIQESLPLVSRIRRTATHESGRPHVEMAAGQIACWAKTATHCNQRPELHYSEYFFVAHGSVLFMLTTAAEPSLENLIDVMQQFPGGQPVLTHFFTMVSLLGSHYSDTVQGLSQEVNNLELKVFDQKLESPASIYTLSRKILGFQQHLAPLSESLDELVEDLEEDHRVGESVLLAARHSAHRINRAEERASSLRDLLSEILQVYSALIGQKQNNDTKMISAWAAILVVPTLIAGIYGMNFDHMPEIHWLLGYPFAIGTMALSSYILYKVFKRRGWL